MSLHLANISPRIRKDELERVFMRFGRCSVQLRDGYGFAVYDFRGDAEKALRSLNGKNICGELIKLSWSKMQPKTQQRFVRASRTDDVQHGRNSHRSVIDIRRNFSRSREAYSARDKYHDNDRGKHKSTAERHDRGNDSRDSGVKPYNRRLGISEEGVDYDRQKEQHDNLENGNELDGQTKFDRYEPDHGDDKGEEYENNASGYIAGSSYRDASQVNYTRVHHRNNLRSRQGCFKCGNAGHKMRDCPLEDGSQRKSSYHPDHRLELDYQIDSKARGRHAEGARESTSVGRLPPCSRSSISAMRHEVDLKPPTVEYNRVKESNHPVSSESKRKSGKVYERKRTREKECETFETCNDKKSRISSVPPRSDHTSPELGTHPSVKANAGSIMHSRSRSPISHFCSTGSVSKSRSNQSRSRNIKSRSRSGSPKSSLHASLRWSPSSCDDAHQSLNGSHEGIQCPQSKDLPSEVGDQFHPEVRDEELSLSNGFKTSLSGCVDRVRSSQLKEILDSEDEIPTSISYLELSITGTSQVGQIPQSENVVLEGELCEPESTKVLRYQITDAPVEIDDVSFSGGVKGDMQADQLHNADVHPVPCHAEVPHPSFLDQNDKNIAVGEDVAEKPSDDVELEIADTLEKLKSKPSDKRNLKSPSEVYHHLSISKEELCRVLKHYGLKDSEDNQHLGEEDYFGSARLWPWEMIYYRRLKKGAISTENYARRLAQNAAFGITDKYIRRSSGWGELIDDLP
ncbi:hypothetical protein vseg_013246 [Gypsophila vaccaria]